MFRLCYNSTNPCILEEQPLHSLHHYTSLKCPTAHTNTFHKYASACPLYMQVHPHDGGNQEKWHGLNGQMHAQEIYYGQMHAQGILWPLFQHLWCQCYLVQTVQHRFRTVQRIARVVQTPSSTSVPKIPPRQNRGEEMKSDSAIEFKFFQIWKTEQKLKRA